MKNTYIIAVKENLEPTLIQQKPWTDLCQLLSHYWRAYIFETQNEAKRVWKDRRETYEKKQKVLDANQ